MTSEIQMLFNQQLSEYREIKDLREKLRIAEARHQKLADEIQQLLAALPIGDINTDSVATAPACPTHSAGSGILSATRAHQAQMQADINRQRLEAETFDKMVHDWLHAPLKGRVQ